MFVPQEPGLYTIEIIATDSLGMRSEKNMNLNVNLNQAPQNLSISLDPANPKPGDEVVVSVQANDPDDSDIEYEIAVLHDGSLIDEVNDNVLNFIVETGLYTIIATATDPLGEYVRKELCFEVSAETEKKPEIERIEIIPVAPKAQEDEVQVSIEATDPDDQYLNYEVTVKHGDDVILKQTKNEFNFIPEQEGEYEIEVKVSDPEGNSTSRIERFTVLPPNRAPLIIGIDQIPTSPKVGDDIRLIVRAYDPDKDPITYNLVLKYSGRTIASSSNNQIEFRASQSGRYTLCITVTDNHNHSTSETKFIDVSSQTPTNRAPVISRIAIAPTNPTACQDIVVSVYAYDPDNDPIYYVIEVKDPNGIVIGQNPNSHTSSFHVQLPGIPGNYTVDAYVYDMKGASSEETYKFSAAACAKQADIHLSKNRVLLMLQENVDISGISTPNSDSYRYWIEDPNSTIATDVANVGGTFNFSFKPTIPGTYTVNAEFFWWPSERIKVAKTFVAIDQTPSKTNYVRIIYPDGICVLNSATTVKATSTANVYGVILEVMPISSPSNVITSANIVNPGPPAYLYVMNMNISTPGVYIAKATAYIGSWANPAETDISTFCVEAPPTCAIHLSANNVSLNDSINATLVATDTDGRIIISKITVDSTEQICNASICSITFSPTQAGVLMFTGVATDDDNHSAVCQATVNVVDNTVPWIELDLTVGNLTLYSTHTSPSTLVTATYCVRAVNEIFKASDDSIMKLWYQYDHPVNGLISGSETVSPYSPWSTSTSLSGEGIYNATMVATDVEGNTATLLATILIDRTSPTVDLDISTDTLCGTTLNRATYTATDANFVEGVLRIYGGSYSNQVSITSATEDSTISLHASSGEYDRTIFTVELIATDCAGNEASKSATFVADTKFGEIEFNPPNIIKAATTIYATLTDLSSICAATVSSAISWSASESVGSNNPTITVHATVLGGWHVGCGATKVTVKATIDVVAHIEGTVTITLKATDCCCSNDCASKCNNSDSLIRKIHVDTMPPTTTSTPVLYLGVSGQTATDLLRIEQWDEINVCSQISPFATVEYHYSGGTGIATSNTYQTGTDPLRIEFKFNEDQIPDDTNKATVSYRGICDALDNERIVIDQPATVVHTHPISGR